MNISIPTDQADKIRKILSPQNPQGIPDATVIEYAEKALAASIELDEAARRGEYRITDFGTAVLNSK